MAEFVSKSIAKRIVEEVLGNTLEFGDEVFGTALGEKQLDTGGIEPDAYFGTLFTDWDQAVRSMKLPSDIETYRRYLYIRHLKLFGFKRDKDGVFVTAERRIPARLTGEENFEIVSVVIRDMEQVRRGEATIDYNGRMRPVVAPNAREEGPPRASAYETLNSYPEIPTQPEPQDEFIGSSDDEDIDPRSRPKRPSDVFGVPETSHTEQGRRRMRPDDHFGSPETRVNLSSAEPERVSVFRTASAPRTPASGHTYSMSIRPGETKTQRIELPGLTLELVISMVA